MTSGRPHRPVTTHHAGQSQFEHNTSLGPSACHASIPMASGRCAGENAHTRHPTKEQEGKQTSRELTRSRGTFGAKAAGSPCTQRHHPRGLGKPSRRRIAGCHSEGRTPANASVHGNDMDIGIDCSTYHGAPCSALEQLDSRIPSPVASTEEHEARPGPPAALHPAARVLTPYHVERGGRGWELTCRVSCHHTWGCREWTGLPSAKARTRTAGPSRASPSRAFPAHTEADADADDAG
ncbi:hypothetical protein C8Q80DRAFT_549284 [Daedaleopsis nitida]|nr:hypothetical protein C8Q80DRAFT_549284 [Daedaleopsis nitida]